MPEISYEDFAKLEIKIGTITAIEIVEDADKLLKLSVDVGEEAPRQIVSGIRTYFEDINSLVGKQCPFLTNLAPRTIRGLESQGMILTAEDTDGKLQLLKPENVVSPGSNVS